MTLTRAFAIMLVVFVVVGAIFALGLQGAVQTSGEGGAKMIDGTGTMVQNRAEEGAGSKP
jgi:hypothetical protein